MTMVACHFKWLENMDGDMRRAFRYAISILVAYLRHANSLHKTQIPAIEITGYLCQMPKGINLPYRTLCRPSGADSKRHVYLSPTTRVLIGNDTCTYWQWHWGRLRTRRAASADTPFTVPSRILMQKTMKYAVILTITYVKKRHYWHKISKKPCQFS